MVGFITLRGSLSGSIRLTTVGKSTRFVLKLREKPPRGGFTVYLIDGEDFASFRFPMTPMSSAAQPCFHAFVPP